MPECPYEQRSEEWLAARIGHITASTAAGCLGVDPYKGPITAWKDIMGLNADRVLNRSMRWGVERECDAREDYECHTGNLVRLCGFWEDDGLPWLGASPDGLIGDDGGLECKCPGELPSAVPSHHEIQCRICMRVTGRAWWDYFAWTPHAHYLERIHRDLAKEAHLLEQLKVFYDTFVATNVPPPRRKPRRKVKAEEE